MYPPASLDFDDALAESATLPGTLRRPHLLSADMVVGIEHLTQIDDENLIRAGFDREHHVTICITGVPFRHSTDALDRIRSFHAQAREARVPRRVVALEVYDERPFDDDAEGIMRGIRQLAIVATGAGIALYYEPRWTDSDWAERIDDAIPLLREAAAGDRAPVGLKVRCAGKTALRAPTLARIIAAAADQHLALKATQGLHHPLVEPGRHESPIGFLGLVVAHRLRIGLGDSVSVQDIERCLQEQQPAAFRFLDDRLGYRGHILEGDALARALVPPLNIGSCSLLEPDEDLQRLFGAPRPVIRRGPHNA